jgi:outer membrane biosynthesis protein TonB
MAKNGTNTSSVRVSRFEMERLAYALALSLLLHLLTWGGYEIGKKFGWWQSLHWPRWMQHASKIPLFPQPPVANHEQPLEFVTVDQASTEAPKNAKYYSSQNSRAADLEGTHESDTPKVSGHQTDVPKMEDAPRQQFSKLQPSPPAQPADQEQAQQPSSVNSGDLTLGKPQDSQSPADQQTQPRPRTVRQALAQLNRTPGVAVRQNGGARRRALSPSLDALSTSFGAYDAAVVEAIQQRWDDLLDSGSFAQDRSGRVTLQFHLNYDGTITDMRVLDNTVGELLGYVCQQAITQPAPYAKWPDDMRREIGQNFREITFTFYYY